jgi:hypothetical protein
MAKRDVETTARNKVIEKMTVQLKAMEAEVLRKTGFSSVASMHGKIGGKFAEFIDIKDQVIHSSQQFISLYLEGFKIRLKSLEGYDNPYTETFKLLRQHIVFKEYLFLFLERTYLRNIDSLSKVRPGIDEAEIWIGQENASYGLLVTPRFKNGQWENDQSEIRHFEKKYWSIGHVLETGLVVPGREKKITFKDIPDYLTFFSEVLVRNSGSLYEQQIADLYCEFVTNNSDPLSIPLLIPEFRYEGKEKKHVYRLDFTIIESKDLNKIGFELSPWSTHGYLKNTKALNQTQINEMASDNFSKEMKKHRSYFKKHGVFVLIYPDDQLEDVNVIFDDMSNYLILDRSGTQLKYHILEDFFN